MSVPTRRLVDSAGADTAGLVTATPDAYTQLRRLKDIVDAVEALGYKFTINGINFNEHSQLKTLMLPSQCNSGAFLAFTHWNDAGNEVDYQVPTGKVFIVFQALVFESNALGIAVVGETFAAGTSPFTKEVLFLGNGTALPSMESCWGVFAADEYVTASSIDYNYKVGSALYGVEVDA